MRQLLTSLRTLLRFKTYTVINLAGLVFSVACALIIVCYIHQERTVDHFCPELERTFLMTSAFEGTSERMVTQSIDLNRDPEYVDPLKDPCVEKVSCFYVFDNDCVTVDGRAYNVQTLVADSLYFQMLPRPLLAGVSQMRTPKDVLISKQLAKRLFKDNDPLGKTLRVSVGETVTVVGVMDDAPTKASIDFDLVISSDLRRYWQGKLTRGELVQLYRAEDMKLLNEKNSKPMKLRMYGSQAMTYQLVPLKELYMNENVKVYYGVKRGNPTSLTILSVVALMLLLVGIFNYINLHTVVMLKRAREFGLKKVFGANGWEVFRQLYFENFCMGAIAVFLVWVVEEATRGLVHNWLGIPVVRDVAFDCWVSAALVFGIPLLTSIFPFLRYNFAPPVSSLRSINMGGNSVVSRTTFIFLQYVITICLIVAAVYFSRQLHYVLHYDLNYRTEDIIRCQMRRMDTVAEIMVSDEEWKAQREKEKRQDEWLVQQMNESPLFTHWALGEAPILSGEWGSKCILESGEEVTIQTLFCNRQFMELFGFKLKEGRLWDNEIDNFRQYRLILTESAMRALGIENMREGKVQFERRIWWSMGIDESQNPPFEVVGVIEDFKTGHLASPDTPLALVYSEGSVEAKELMGAIAPGKKAEAIAFLEDLYRELNGEGEFEYTFLEDDLAKLYEEDERATHIYITFALIAILISCLGLFGLSLYDIEQRYREIALRKIHGASTSDIVRLLLRKYYLILGAAFVLASAISYAAIHWYMQDYHHHAPISWWIFALAGVLIALISMGTIRWQIHKAVNMNPADVMKSE